MKAPMRFTYLDRILELEPGRRILATKSLSLTEDFLQDHFPRFPIMPGVLMLEAMYQTSAWLVRATDGFRHSLVTLAEANNVKYSDFVQPGQTLQVAVELAKQDQQRFHCRGEGRVQDKVAVRGRLVLQVGQLGENNKPPLPQDAYMIESFRRIFRVLYPAGSEDVISRCSNPS
jgi:3-hydroxyacyl-[acyl-carrier-protein] dehydratase